MSRKVKNIILSLFGSLILSTSLFVGFKNQQSAEVKADSLSEIGKFSITNMEVYHPYSNENEFVLLDLEGTDYPSSGDSEIFNANNIEFEFNFDNDLYFYNLDETRINIPKYYEIYARMYGANKQFTFSIWLDSFAGAKKGRFVEGFKIPSYSYLKGDTESPTYGYYSLDKDYEVIAEDINYTATPGGKYAWKVIDESYDQREAYITNLFSYVDGTHEMLTFQVFGIGVDYINAGDNAHFDISQSDSLLSNFKSKVHLYDENKTELTYNFEFVSTINLWAIKPTYSVGIDILNTAKHVYVESGLILPSFAKLNGDTSSPLYDGFVIQNELELSIDESVAHTTGARIPWAEQLNIIDELTIAKIYTNNPHGNANEFFCITFNEDTDFASLASLKWDASKYSLLKNLSTHYHLYNSSNVELSNELLDVYFCYTAVNTGSNSISIMTSGSGDAVKASLQEGLLIPSYALYCGDRSSNSYGYYSLKLDYEVTIEAGHSTHTQHDSIKWNVPSCQIEYYDENNNLISSLNDDAVLGSTYYLKSAPEKTDYFASWEVISPADIEVIDNKIIIPLTIQTIKLKVIYTEVKMCTIQYLDENGELLSDLSNEVLAGFTYSLEPLISKKGHDAAWEIVNPSGLEIINNQITLPNEELTVVIQIKYTPRTYVVYFENSINKEVTFNEPIGELPVIAEEDGKVGKWVIDGEFIDENTIYSWDENKTATSTYVDRMCVISFDVKGGEELDNVEFNYGEVVSELPIPVKEGCIFNYWTVDENGLIPFALDCEIYDDVVLYASWLNKCVVKFDSNGGSLLEDVIIGEGQKLKRQPVPTRDGYRFICWMLDDTEFNFNNKINSDVTLVAKWEKIDNSASGANKKCGGNIITTSILLSFISFIGIGAILVKRKTQI